ncbi:50S ribosomal protein L25/general stress protein Ctc [Methylococcus sp. EFPC2]|uniref:50S ribosomal protein L25/general stress protein Ctc n=1 Tax=Methylococcus sp. EFPC2 TaxID=2812648 RepID=UPI0019675296|nr:50S ribosomal protein L25/general stress protein Ctc [Methylococcus sp. EFPC2]QSA96355.1 50S ribosomal protein L25/general stress protein Ctc [Methylococcus sp. EFPC2]
MVGSFEFDAELRSRTGKGDARRSRLQGKIPAIVYGGGADPVQLFLTHHKVAKALENEATYSHILTVKYDGKEEKVILKALQRHPARPIIMHIDFQRVNEKDKLHVHVPLHFINQETSVGVKKGGVVTHAVVEVEVVCLPQNLPEYIEVDLADLDIGDSIHLADLKLPAGVQIHALTQGPEHNLPVAAILATRATDTAE